MDTNFVSFKTLEDVKLKATYSMRIGDTSFSEGETIAAFDKIQISGLTELKDYVAARGGFDNRGLVFWETTKQLNLTFSQGVFSKTQFSLLTNGKMTSIVQEDPILITYTEESESNENKIINTKYTPYDQIFVYNKQTGQKISYTKENGNIMIDDKFLDVIITYRYNYTAGGTCIKIGQSLLNGFVELEGKTRVKDDTSGLITTGIIRIPKLKLMSGLSIRLGTQANPVVANFSAVGVPTDSRKSSYVAEFIFLNNDIDSDM